MGKSREQINGTMSELLNLATPETQARVSALLTELSGDFDEILTESETATTEMQRLSKDNETLRAVNTKLFLKVGEAPKGGTTNPEPPVEEPTDIPTFESLFNEKGELM